MTVAYEYKSKDAGGLDFLCRNSPCGHVNKCDIVRDYALIGDAILALILREECLVSGIKSTELYCISNDLLSEIYDITEVPYCKPGKNIYNNRSKGTIIEALIATIFLDTGRDYLHTKSVVLNIYGDIIRAFMTRYAV